MHRVAFQTVDHYTRQCIALVVLVTDDHGIVIRDTEDVWQSTPHGHIFNIGEAAIAIVHLDTIFLVPIASDDYSSAVQFQSRSVCSFQCHTAEAVEGVGGRIVHFS